MARGGEYDDENHEEIWRTEQRDERPMVTFTDHADEALTKGLGWRRPVKWNHACFDVLFLESKNKKLKVVQITDGKKHSCKLQHLILYVQALQVYIIDFVFVCRRKNFDSFKVYNPFTKKRAEKYNELIEALENICNLKKKRTRDDIAAVTFRKVCYEKLDRQAFILPLA